MTYSYGEFLAQLQKWCGGFVEQLRKIHGFLEQLRFSAMYFGRSSKIIAFLGGGTPKISMCTFGLAREISIQSLGGSAC